ncbi:odorant receptor 22a-like [Megachile rotundata]|uniref:odorant receptor 22a-like n=1 Tax=Megachile rotundata TaxID=143995 RepID=UPI003FD6BE21
MDTIVSERRYFKITRLYLNIVGIWPYQSKYSQYFLQSTVYIIMVSCILAQIAYVIYFFNIKTLTNQLFIIVTCSMSLVKHFMCCAKGSKFKVLLDGMFEDLETDKSTDELAIMIPYLTRAIYMTTFYAYGTMTLTGVFVQMPFLPIIVDILAPLNTSRPQVHSMEVYYFFVDTTDHSYWTMLHIDLALIITGIASVGCDAFYINTVQHACGLFKVAGYRFKCAIDNSDVRQIAESSRETYKKVCRCIKAHSRAIRYVREIDDFFYGMLFFAVGITVIALSSSLFWLSKLKPSEEFYMHLTSLSAELWHILFLTFLGQLIINSTDSVYDQIYEGKWYNSVPKTQELFILALRAALDPPQMTAGGLFSMNLQTFAEIVKVSFSYFTVLQSA